jgi:hypothetical protein
MKGQRLGHLLLLATAVDGWHLVQVLRQCESMEAYEGGHLEPLSRSLGLQRTSALRSFWPALPQLPSLQLGGAPGGLPCAL